VVIWYIYLFWFVWTKKKSGNPVRQTNTLLWSDLMPILISFFKVKPSDGSSGVYLHTWTAFWKHGQVKVVNSSERRYFFIQKIIFG
jgi:hypothetical protein